MGRPEAAFFLPGRRGSVPAPILAPPYGLWYGMTEMDGQAKGG